MSEARQLHRDIVEFVDAAQNEMLTKLQYVDKIFGNVNYLTTVEQEMFQGAFNRFWCFFFTSDILQNLETLKIGHSRYRSFKSSNEDCLEFLRSASSSGENVSPGTHFWSFGTQDRAWRCDRQISKMPGTLLLCRENHSAPTFADDDACSSQQNCCRGAKAETDRNEKFSCWRWKWVSVWKE